MCRFFGGFGGFGGQQEEESTPKGNDVVVDLEVSLQDLYLGNHFEVRFCPKPYPSLIRKNAPMTAGLQHLELMYALLKGNIFFETAIQLQVAVKCQR